MQLAGLVELQLLGVSVWDSLASLLNALARAFPGLKRLRLQSINDTRGFYTAVRLSDRGGCRHR